MVVHNSFTETFLQNQWNSGVQLLFSPLVCLVMTGLKSYLPVLAGHLKTTPDALYERQRQLTRLGLLLPTGGRGPGSGIRVSPAVVTMMVLARLATDNLADAAVCADFLFSKGSDLERCPLTGATTFGKAIELIFASEKIASAVNQIEVLRSDLRAQIYFSQKGKHGASKISGFGKELGATGLQSSWLLPGETVMAIASELAAIATKEK